MNSEDLRLRKIMETSDLPKLSQRFVTGQSLLQVSWQEYKKRMTWLMTKFSISKLQDQFDKSNPLVTLFTWTVMVPVGGTFCIFGWFMLMRLYRKKVKINQVNYSMNQYQKKAFLNKVFKSNKIENKYLD